MLMNQKMLAGIGNLYSDEILFQARIHPKTSVAQLDDPTLENLHHETLRVLKKAIEQKPTRKSYQTPTCSPTGKKARDAPAATDASRSSKPLEEPPTSAPPARGHAPANASASRQAPDGALSARSG